MIEIVGEVLLWTIVSIVVFCEFCRAFGSAEIVRDAIEFCCVDSITGTDLNGERFFYKKEEAKDGR